MMVEGTVTVMAVVKLRTLPGRGHMRESVYTHEVKQFQ